MGRGAGRWSRQWPAGTAWRRGAVGPAALASAGFTALVWWPHGEYRPIQPGEKGTIVSGIRSIREIPTGRASLTFEREAQLAGAPTERSLQRYRRAELQTTPRFRRGAWSEDPSVGPPTA